MSRGLRNNNPGNIRLDGVHWKGEKEPSADKEFKQFKTMAWGYRAMFQSLNTYYTKYGLDTIRKMISRWAPPTENHTDNYVKTVSDRSGTPPDSRITATNRDVMVPIVAAMSCVENGVDARMADVEAGWELFLQNR